MKGGRTHHIALSVRGAIRELEHEPPEGASYFQSAETGDRLTNTEALTALTLALAKGEEMLPMGEKCGNPCGHAAEGCTGFNYGKGGGCPGYPTPVKDDTQ